METGAYGFLPTITSSLQKNIKNRIQGSPRETREAKVMARITRKALREKKRNTNDESTSMTPAAAALGSASINPTTTSKTKAGRQKEKDNDFNCSRFDVTT